MIPSTEATITSQRVHQTPRASLRNATLPFHQCPALIVTVNAIETLGYKENFYAKVEEGNFELQINQTNDVIEGLLINLEYTLNELAAQYKTYIKNHKEG